ncbi:uncharacterized protein PHALS_15189 [Plasmopara halstedii]|uniref:Uncharacterized protein n=1 Tax=Plasmopara halstedii TaxID=4781 RepID=A0A0P1B446_PLAHL|nr:uncharacterized protein PHALS_15189 [Plasmopara halstedii]CEG49056.1 hypothetical protein PHALS_15189 [Plasmopara halstedii]|eukprot:XP_024585425.1 hypothetical protein PHALS_15189 [Plasmopara halstedii]
MRILIRINADEPVKEPIVLTKDDRSVQGFFALWVKFCYQNRTQERIYHRIVRQYTAMYRDENNSFIVMTIDPRGSNTR